MMLDQNPLVPTDAMGPHNQITTLQISNLLSQAAEGVDKMSFPLKVFPQKMQKLILYLVKNRNLKLEFVASCMITAAAAAIGNSRRVQSREGWKLAPMFYMILVGRPGIGKTPPLEFAFRPLGDIDRAREKEYAEQYKRYLVQKAEYERAKGAGEPPEPPPLIRTLISDFTQEAMVKMHADNFRGLCVKYDEIIGFFRTADRYNSSSLITDMLTMFTGGQLINSRKEQTKSLSIEYPCVSLIGTTQTTMLPEFIKFNLIKNGFMDRFIFVRTQDNKVPLWSKTPSVKTEDYCPEEVWKEIVDRLMTLEPDLDSASGGMTSRVMELSSSASERFVDWHNEGARMQNEIQDDSLINTRIAKWDSQVPRLALVIQLLAWACYEGDGDVVSLESMEGAIRLNVFFEECYEEFAAYFSPNKLPPAKEALINALPDEFTTAQAVSVGKQFGLSESTVKHDLPKFIDGGYITCLCKGKYKKNKT